MLHYLPDSVIRAVKFLFHVDTCVQRGGLAWQLKSGVKVQQIVLQNEYCV